MPVEQIAENPQGVALRLESRQSVVHVVDYSHYPRRDAFASRRVAYTQDRSENGLGLDLPEVVTPGELLRVSVRDVDGNIEIDGLVRVVWCDQTERGRARAGVSMLREEGQRPMMRVRSQAAVGSETEDDAPIAIGQEEAEDERTAGVR